jgi:hypothetical protein
MTETVNPSFLRRSPDSDKDAIRSPLTLLESSVQVTVRYYSLA